MIGKRNQLVKPNNIQAAVHLMCLLKIPERDYMPESSEMSNVKNKNDLRIFIS